MKKSTTKASTTRVNHKARAEQLEKEREQRRPTKKQQQKPAKNMYKLGTLENRQMRQSYQVNSMNN